MDLSGLDAYGDSYEWGMKQLRDALNDRLRRDHKYIYHLLASKGDDDSVARIVELLRVASRNRSISPELVSRALPDVTVDSYSTFVSLLLKYHLLIPIRVQDGEYRLDHELADLLFSSGSRRSRSAAPSVILHADPERGESRHISSSGKREPYWRTWVNSALAPSGTAGDTQSAASVWARLWGAVSRMPIRNRREVYGQEIDRATNTMDDVLNRLGPPPEPLGQDVDLPEPTPAGAS